MFLYCITQLIKKYVQMYKEYTSLHVCQVLLYKGGGDEITFQFTSRSHFNILQACSELYKVFVFYVFNFCIHLCESVGSRVFMYANLQVLALVYLRLSFRQSSSWYCDSKQKKNHVLENERIARPLCQQYEAKTYTLAVISTVALLA